MTPVNSTSRRASTSNQWLVSSVSAHHAPPYMFSSLSVPWSWPDIFLGPVLSHTYIPYLRGYDEIIWLPACWVVLFGPKSHDETARRPATGRLPPGGTPNPEEDTLRKKQRNTHKNKHLLVKCSRENNQLETWYLLYSWETWNKHMIRVCN